MSREYNKIIELNNMIYSMIKYNHLLLLVINNQFKFKLNTNFDYHKEFSQNFPQYEKFYKVKIYNIFYIYL